MKILAMDTSSPNLSVAVYGDGAVLREENKALTLAHSATLAPAIQKILKAVKWKLQAVDFIVVGLGPGSFTGLRVGITTAKTLAYAAGCKLVGVPSLEAMARECAFEGRAAVLLDAKKNQFYCAVYEKKGSAFREVAPPALLPAAATEAVLKTADRRIGEEASPRAAFLIPGALERIKQKKIDSVWSIQPLYLYAKDCNVTLKRKK